MSTIHIFVSYSHRDSRWVKASSGGGSSGSRGVGHDTWVQEGTHALIPWLAQQLKKNGVEIWYDHALKQMPGAEYKKLIQSQIDRADIAILLISQDFLTSDFIKEYELPRIRERVDRGDCSLVPIMVGPALDEDLDWLADRQMLPGKPVPLIDYTDNNARWQAVRLDILKAIRSRAADIASRRPPEPSPPAAPAAAEGALPREGQAASHRTYREDPVEARKSPRVGEFAEEESESAATKAPHWLSHAGGSSRKKKTIAAAIALGLLAVVATIAYAVTLKIKHPDGQETVVNVPEGSEVDVSKDAKVTVTLPKAEAGAAGSKTGVPATLIGPDGKWKLTSGGPSPAIAPFDAAKAKELQEAWAKQLGVPAEIVNSVGMRLVLVPPGEFDMGSRDSDQGALVSEKPQHRVRITAPFYVGKYLVTQQQWDAVMGSNPSQFKGPKNPVETISWDHCQVFLSKLNAKTAGQGGKFVLPSEAQWEYACRAGSATNFCFGDDESQLGDYGWYKDNSGGVSHPVGEKKPNAWGLYDVYGNVYEWCQDWFGEGYYVISPADDPTGPASGTLRVVRAGGRDSPARRCWSACRGCSDPAKRYRDVGLRVVMIPADSAAELAKLRPADDAGKDSSGETAGNTSPAATSPDAGLPALPTIASLVGADGKWKIPAGGPPPAVAPFDETKAKEYQAAWARQIAVPVEITAFGMKLLLIPPGEFDMGSPEADKEASYREKPQHHVRITRPFYLGKYPVTQEQWEAVMGSNPSDVKAAKDPVGSVSWDHCQVFLKKLNAKIAGRGISFGLPTEAQWEYACRAGTTTKYYFGDDAATLTEYAWYGANADKKMHPVGAKLSNPWGLYDLPGSVWQWCQDSFDDRYYAISPMDDPPGPSGGPAPVDRGGGFLSDAMYCRSASRDYWARGNGSGDQGLRVCLALVDTAAELARQNLAGSAGQDSAGTAAKSPRPAGSLIGPDGKWKIPPGGPPPAIAPFDETQAKEHQAAWARQLGVPVEITNAVGMKLTFVPPGEFDMGSPDPDEYGLNYERPQHRVRITKPFYLGKYPVTQEQWQAMMGGNPSKFQGANNPVDKVSWNQSQVFLTKLNAKTAGQGGKFVLPTEAQWEYACRAGTITKYSFGNDEKQLGDYAWYNANSQDSSHPVGEKKPNPWGLYDLHGNMCAWCQDWYEYNYYQISPMDDPTGAFGGATRVCRGGSWSYAGSDCRSATRETVEPALEYTNQGLRVAMILGDTVFERAKLSRSGNALQDSSGTAAAKPAPAAAISIAPSPPRLPVVASFVGADGNWKLPSGGPSPAIAPLDAAKAQEIQAGWARQLGVPVEVTNALGMKLALIPPGEFLMGSPDADKDAHANEKPQHHVRITKPFYLSKYAVTQEQWNALMGNNPSKFKSPDDPVELVTWEQCQVFLTKLNQITSGQGGRSVLPSEAQWEYACRAGSTTKFCFGDDETQLGDYAWYKTNSADKTHQVGLKQPNAWGLFDVHGNVWEWCRDWYDEGYYVISSSDDPLGLRSGTLRVVRGGGWINPGAVCRSADRNSVAVGLRGDGVGFRVALLLSAGTSGRTKSSSAGSNTGSGQQDSTVATAVKTSPAVAIPATQSPARLPAAGSFVGPDGNWKIPAGGPSPAVAPFDAATAKAHQEAWAKQLAMPVEITNAVGMKLLLIPPGEFQMGSPDADKDARNDEKPQHRVRISKPFYLGKYAVTQQQWEAVMGSNPSQTKGLTNPVNMVNWDHCQVFLKKLNAVTAGQGGKFALPTSAQWEYACRAGSTTKYSFGDDEAQLGDYAWYKANSGEATHAVGEKKPNAWGLYDVHGNVWEWCQDTYNEGYYVISPLDNPAGSSEGTSYEARGGSYFNVSALCRTTRIDNELRTARYMSLGFRACLVLADK